LPSSVRKKRTVEIDFVALLGATMKIAAPLLSKWSKKDNSNLLIVKKAVKMKIRSEKI
jgi:hypothetical protein